MRLLRYGPAGLERPGLLDADGRIRDLSAHVHDVAGTTLLPSSLQRLAAIDVTRLPLVAEKVRVGACVGKVGKLVLLDESLTSLQLIATSALGGPEDGIVLPVGQRARCVPRLGIVVGEQARYVARERALTHVAGFSLLAQIVPEGSEAAALQHLDGFAPMGPWLVTRGTKSRPEEMDDRVRGAEGAVAGAVAFVSGCMTLNPGDVLSLAWFGPQLGLLTAEEPRRHAISGLGQQLLRAASVEPERRATEQAP